MLPETIPPPVWIATTPSLLSLAGQLGSLDRIAVDTESNSLHAFKEQLCLVQFSTPGKDFLVDPLALKDLAPLKPVFQDARIEKVFHAVEYDLVCLKRDHGIGITHLFDTMQAARILGYSRVGLDSMLELKLGIKVNKKYQKADWGERPLSSEMLNYARLDTHYLLELRDQLEAELKTRSRWELAQEEFTRLAEGGNGNGRLETLAWQRVKGAQKFTDRQLTILQELCAWRDEQARSMNRPPFKVIDDQRLVAITLARPTTRDELQALDLTPRQVDHYGSEILKAVKHGLQNRPVSRPQTSRPSQATLDRLNLLSEWRKKTGGKWGVESDIILPKAWMHTIAEKKPLSLPDLAKCMPNAPWRLAQFGEQILALLAGRTG